MRAKESCISTWHGVFKDRFTLAGLRAWMCGIGVRVCANWVLHVETIPCISAWTCDMCSEGTSNTLFHVARNETELSVMHMAGNEPKEVGRN